MILHHEPESTRPRDVLRHYLGDIVYGANDGLVTTFTVVSGVAGAQLPPAVVLILGFVNLLGDGFSMGASNFLAIRSSAGAEGRDRGFREPLIHGAATFSSFLIVGLVPLLSYIVPLAPASRFTVSSILAALTLFLVGSMRALVLHRSWSKCGTEMLAVGSIAAGVAYGVGMTVRHLS